MLELGLALEDEPLIIRLATLENPENFGRKYPAALPEETTANLPFSDSRRIRVKFRQRGLSQPKSNIFSRRSGSPALVFHLNEFVKNISNFSMNFFVGKMSFFQSKILENRRYDPC